MLPVEMVNAWRSLTACAARATFFLSPRPVSSSTSRQLMTAGVCYCNKLLVLAVRPVCNARLFTLGSDFESTCRRGRASCVLASGSLPLFQEDVAGAEGAAKAQLAKSARADGTSVLASPRVGLAN